MRDSWKIMAVQDAYKAFPYADAMYGCNPSWWRVHKDCPGFNGQKWTSHEANDGDTNDKLRIDPQLGKSIADAFGLNVCGGRHGDEFSLDHDFIRYGSNSGFQAINLAILFGCKRIVLVGFDMGCPGGESHFFGDHPKELHQNRDADYRAYIKNFAVAAKKLPPDISIVNATPGSALNCFPMMRLEDAMGATCSSPEASL